MSLLKIEMPWWLKGTIIEDLKTVLQAAWDVIEQHIDKINQVSHIETTVDAAIDLLWQELPIQPDINKEDRRNFIKYYDQYLEYLGTRPGIMLTKEMFDLEQFDLEALRETANAAFHPWFALRIYLNYEDELERIKQYLKIVAPARCKFHTHLIKHKEAPGRFGINRFGKRFG